MYIYFFIQKRCKEKFQFKNWNLNEKVIGVSQMLYNHLFLTFSSQICHTQKIHSRTERQTVLQSIIFLVSNLFNVSGFCSAGSEKHTFTVLLCQMNARMCRYKKGDFLAEKKLTLSVYSISS